MEKYTRFLPQGLLLCYVVKSFFIVAGVADAGIIFSLAAVTIFYEYRVKDQQMKAVTAALEEQKQEFEELKLKMRAIEGNMSGLRLGLGARTMSNTKV
jgi:Tfp pilus assembly major pilin PilA